jgi:hypothetical protein
LTQAEVLEPASEPILSPLASAPASSQESDSDASCATDLSSGTTSSDEEEAAVELPTAQALRHMRRSSIIPISTDQPVPLGTRLILFRGLPKAKQRSYFQYMQQMAELYAEVRSTASSLIAQVLPGLGHANKAPHKTSP